MGDFKGLFFVIFLLLFISEQGISVKNNVCKTLPDYYTIDNNRNCWYDPEVDMNITQLIQWHKYPVEQYEVTTDDGYILTIFRIPHNGSLKRSPPIYLQHGMSLYADSWFSVGNDSLPFLLSDAGYDVWISNARGTKYSRKHVKFTTATAKYWNFSFHEIGVYDLSAVINLINKKTYQKVIYIGHSMGTIEGFIYASFSKHNATNKLANIITLAPGGYFGHMKCPIVWILLPFRHILTNFLTNLNIYSFDVDYNLFAKLTSRLCSIGYFVPYCSGLLNSMTGVGTHDFRPEIVPKLIRKYPAGFSLKTVLHGFQLLASDRFQQYDYGPIINNRIYNSSSAPDYNVENIKVPVHMFYGENDLLLDKEGLQRFYNRLTTKKKSLKALLNDTIIFSHGDFFNGWHNKEVANEIFKAIES